ncbi:hypothetical protein BDM02DRAFT_3267781 [Thelephora ganbajun]|uniref:Uncharacterized protein n=1 Tax=Thelephora ganbajun TaxID=370292 RepID=A0ACB6ZMX0_THEGA|nr:hypothetical protein BDM02DRAFT_3267781 [Thelephora ganbajun]
MPPNRTSTQQNFNTDLPEREALVAPGGLPTALDWVERVCYHGDSSIMEMIVKLNSRPHILEYILSTLDGQAYERLSKWIIARFPAPTTTTNVMEVLGTMLLQRLSSSLMSVEAVSTVEHRNELKELRRKVGLSLNVLKELGGCADRASVGTNVSPISRKRSKVLARHLQLDPHPFDCMGIAVPVTEDEIRAVCGDILFRLQNILGNYLLILRRPRISDVFKRQFEESGITTAPSESTNRLIKAALYFENVEGFGEWRILLSTRAQKYLRETRRGNVVVFEIVVKKIK